MKKIRDYKKQSLYKPKVKDCSRSSLSCPNLTSLDVSSWDTSNTIDMNSIFRSCSSLPISNTPCPLPPKCYSHSSLPVCENPPPPRKKYD